MTNNSANVVLRDFKVSANWWNLDIWGNNHTILTDPTKKGWRAFRAPINAKLVLVGRKGVKGCFTALLLSNNKIDVLIYDDFTPEEVIAIWEKNERPLFDDSMMLDNICGWGLSVISNIEKNAE